MYSKLCRLRDKNKTLLKVQRREGVKGLKGIKKWKKGDEG
jgi:hypothetical protein